jgi:hypothetical protein
MAQVFKNPVSQGTERDYLEAGRYALPRNGNMNHLDHYRLLRDHYHPPGTF